MLTCGGCCGVMVTRVGPAPSHQGLYMVAGGVTTLYRDTTSLSAAPVFRNISQADLARFVKRILNTLCGLIVQPGLTVLREVSSYVW